jgi:hypothetical protein
LVKSQGCHCFRIQTFSAYTTASPPLESIINFCKKIHFLAKNIASDQGKKIKDNFDKNVLPHNFSINDLVWYEDFVPLGKNAKLTPKWQGPAKITEISETNARVLPPKGKTKNLNVMCTKKIF